MGQKDKKQPVSLDHRKIDSRGRFRGADVRGYARMRKAMLEREKRLEARPEDPNKDHVKPDQEIKQANQ